uniref:Palmitoyltransferase n=1 Tax=Albugo laibachii Nc14 TaxID=890382 RepID=F0WA37_9STRA|nr:palmitoyltransferase putative [Albugo laibachii Nc14]|eukprot:CCA18007.1 palmitoyltransferase putative [Albugo laibachii Nc14]
MLRVHPSWIVRIGSTVPILLVLSIILMECYLYWTAYLLSSCFSESSVSRAFHAVIFHYFLLLVMLCYVRVALTDPGYVTTALLNKFSDALPSAMENDDGDPQHLQKLPICRKCNQPKPLRTHHCSFCNKCVLKMDHHCPWVANCIGLCNYKFFLQFITYALIAIVMLMEKLLTRFERSVWSLQRSKHIRDVMELSAFEFMAYVVAIAIGCSILLLFITHLYLIIYGFTTIECHSITSHSRYSRGWKHNLSDVFGDRIFDWIFPTKHAPLESDFIVSAIHSDRWNAGQHSDGLTDEEHSLL